MRRATIRVVARGAAVLVLLAGVVGCDLKKVSELEEGVATEADVRAKFGQPDTVYDEADGSHTLEYPRQPAGQVNYMITIGTDGKMSALRQVLKPSNFAKVQPGWDKPQVRRLLGLQAKVRHFPMQKQEVWDWRFADSQGSKVFEVTFDDTGHVVTSTTMDDPINSGIKN